MQNELLNIIFARQRGANEKQMDEGDGLNKLAKLIKDFDEVNESPELSLLSRGFGRSCFCYYKKHCA